MQELANIDTENREDSIMQERCTRVGGITRNNEHLNYVDAIEPENHVTTEISSMVLCYRLRYLIVTHCACDGTSHWNGCYHQRFIIEGMQAHQLAITGLAKGAQSHALELLQL